MKITFRSGVLNLKEKVVSAFGDFYVTESGAQVRKSNVLKYDRRGGTVKGSGRKKSGKKVPVIVYMTQEDKTRIEARAASLGMSLSSYIATKIL